MRSKPSAVIASMGQSVGALLRQLRGKRGLSLRRMAAMVGVSAPYLSSVERGKIPPPSDKRLAMIARVLGQDPGMLIAEKRERKVPPDIQRIIKTHPREFTALVRAMRNMEFEDFKDLVDWLRQKKEPIRIDWEPLSSIGKPVREYIVEPLWEPVPKRTRVAGGSREPVRAMNIGKPVREYIVEPLVEPVPPKQKSGELVEPVPGEAGKQVVPAKPKPPPSDTATRFKHTYKRRRR